MGEGQGADLDLMTFTDFPRLIHHFPRSPTPSLPNFNLLIHFPSLISPLSRSLNHHEKVAVGKITSDCVESRENAG